jgi:hypothetical protein
MGHFYAAPPVHFYSAVDTPLAFGWTRGSLSKVVITATATLRVTCIFVFITVLLYFIH